MLSLSAENEKRGNMINKIIIPQVYMPSTGYGEIKLIIQDGKIVDCKTTTSHKIIASLKPKRE